MSLHNIKYLIHAVPSVTDPPGETRSVIQKPIIYNASLDTKVSRKPHAPKDVIHGQGGII